MSKADLLALAARCEAAQGPDRELDAEIAAALGWKDVHAKPPNLEWFRPRWIGIPPGGVWNFLPAYTASLDAAASLVPEGWGWEVYSDGGALMFTPSESQWGRRSCTARRAATPALALCAAALRARAAGSVEDKG